MKGKHYKKHKKMIVPVVLVLIAILGGLGVGYGIYVHLDYQKNSDPSKYEGYVFTQPDFLFQTKNFLDNEQEEKQDGDIKVNSAYMNVATGGDSRSGNYYQLLNSPSTRPFFQLIDVTGKQTVYKVIANLSGMKQIERVDFPTWINKGGKIILKTYEGMFDAVTNTWQANIPVKDYRESGTYQTNLMVTKKNGKTEQAQIGEFTVTQPHIDAQIDASRTDKGQFEVNIVVDSKSEIEKLSIPIWSKEDQSDVKWYEAKRQSGNVYSIHVDYEDFDFTNGAYSVFAYYTGLNGLTANSNAGIAEINMSHPVRIRILDNTILYQDRKLTKKVKDLTENSMAYVQAVVFNEDQKIYKTTEGYVSSENIDVGEMFQDIRYVSHRGNHQAAPENSLPAFQKASSWGVETDIWLTKDKKWVVMHDDNVDRMTNGSGRISEMTLEQIRKLRIDTGTNYTTYDQSQLVVPTLEEYLNIMSSKQSVPFIEIKSESVTASDYDNLINQIAQYGLSETAVVISFSYQNLVEIKQRAPQMQVQLLGDVLTEDIVNKVSALGGNAGLDIKYEGAVSNIDMIVKAQLQGLSVHLWGVPQSEFKRMEALGIDNLTTDFD